MSHLALRFQLRRYKLAANEDIPSDKINHTISPGIKFSSTKTSFKLPPEAEFTTNKRTPITGPDRKSVV